MDPMYRYQVLRFYGMEGFSSESPIDSNIKDPHAWAALKRFYARMTQELLNDRNHMVVAPHATKACQSQATPVPTTTTSIDEQGLHKDPVPSSCSSSAQSTLAVSTAPTTTLPDPRATKAPPVITKLSQKVKTAIPILSRSGNLPSAIVVVLKEMYGVEVSLETVLQVLGIAV